MIRWPGGFPVFAAEAHGARFTRRRRPRVRRLLPRRHRRDDRPLARADRARGRRPGGEGDHDDAAERGRDLGRRELTRRFGLARWQFALTATDANRFAIRLARELTGRPKILVFNWCYHGSVDETFVGLEDGRVVSREGNVGPPVPLAETTRVVELNDPEALERELANGDVACVLAEPALTNIGIVLPEPGFHDAAARRRPARPGRC